MTPAEVNWCLANRDRLTPEVREHVAAWIRKNCIDTPEKIAARKVLARVRAELPGRVAMAATLAAAQVKQPRPVQAAGATPLLNRTCRRPPTRCEPS
jgi:hypothetical protein